MNMLSKIEVVPLVHEEHEGFVRGISDIHWGGPQIITRGKIHDMRELRGYVALDQGQEVGLITYRIEKEQCEIISLNSLEEKRGIGTALIQAVKTGAEQEHCDRLWAITSNDNVQAMGFYQKRGYSLVAVHRNAIQMARSLKPQIPLVGIEGIPIRDEIELELLLVPTP